MQFTSKFTGLLMIIAASAMSVQALVAAPRDADVQLDALSVTLFDQIFFAGTSITPTGVQEGVSFNLSSDWVDRARSLIISTGNTCAFFVEPNSQGPAVVLSGDQFILPASINGEIQSFTCFQSE